MNLSVVVPTLNGRDRLAACLDALAVAAPDAELVVVNGPSADGTTGMVRDRDDVDVLVEISDRTVNVARNAGIEEATGDVIALVDFGHRVEPDWRDGLAAGLTRADVVTGPVRDRNEAGSGSGSDRTSSGTETKPETNQESVTDQEPGTNQESETDQEPETNQETVERRTIAGREVTYIAGGNVAFRRGVIDDLDGFDEYLRTGGSRDVSHRLAGMDHEVAWEEALAVERVPRTTTAADGGRDERDWGWKYRALAYRLVKNYGIRPTVIRRTAGHAVGDAYSVARDVIRGEATPSGWAGNGRDVVSGIATGVSDGSVARARDRSPARNPHGISKRADRAVAKYDWRE